MLSFSDREHKAPAYLAINPRGKVPAIDDDGYALYESHAIVEYLEEKWPVRPLLPGGAAERGKIRRLCEEAKNYFDAGKARLQRQTMFARGAPADADEVARAKEEMAAELGRFEGELTGEFLAGPLSLADFTLYPMLAMVRRIGERYPDTGAGEIIRGGMAEWMKRVEALPYFDRTFPPHWRSGS